MPEYVHVRGAALLLSLALLFLMVCSSPVFAQCCPPPPPYCGGGGSLSPVCTSSGWQCQQNNSPIIVDTTGNGFHLTSADGGVTFDIQGNGYPIQIAWTAPASGNAFLALDRNGNGKIDDGKELFGNFTRQPKSDNPNGYIALAEFDKPENGGNGDGIIDSRDAIFTSLLLWIDENHDGISQPEELYTLPELGVYSLSLRYRDEHYFDQYGNWFHYRARLNPDPKDGKSKDGRQTYDVFFVAANGSAKGVRSSPGTLEMDLPTEAQLGVGRERPIQVCSYNPQRKHRGR